MIMMMTTMIYVLCCIVVLYTLSVFQSVDATRCPFGFTQTHVDVDNVNYHDSNVYHRNDFNLVDYDAVKKDLVVLLTDSKEFWPADANHYGPLMIRLAWHCAGSYRRSDGRGGCDGGRIRFNPERSWADNTNLDKALLLLEPIKSKFGRDLSWGDLIVLSGTVAIECMGGPILGFCGGRMDDMNGRDSIKLGPSREQQSVAPCPINGNCTLPLGSTTLGLIYLNPEGPMGNPDPKLSISDVKSAFSRMGMNDSETVALIGGGHAFGKCHGACKAGAGPTPQQDPANPWPGLCGTGNGADTFTSGFEGAWTTKPIEWDNEYFNNLLSYSWQKYIGPGGLYQWRISSPQSDKNIIMLTSDLALLQDKEYRIISQTFADNIDELNKAFMHVWYKLTTSDMGPVTRCAGSNVPPPQVFQDPLPPSRGSITNNIMQIAKQGIIALLNSETKQYSNAAWISTLAYQCADTFRATDYKGGCNGARIRFSPQKDWENNIGMNNVIDALNKVKQTVGNEMSWADLIVLAGNLAIETSSDELKLKFCSGRVDALDGSGVFDELAPREYDSVIAGVKDQMNIKGLTQFEGVALAARLRSSTHQKLLGYSGSYSQSNKLSNEYFKMLLNEQWTPVENSNKQEFEIKGRDSYMMASDLALIWDAEFKAIVGQFASDNQLFLQVFEKAWTKLMNADRFDGPTRNLCDKITKDM